MTFASCRFNGDLIAHIAAGLAFLLPCEQECTADGAPVVRTTVDCGSVSLASKSGPACEVNWPRGSLGELLYRNTRAGAGVAGTGRDGHTTKKRHVTCDHGGGGLAPGGVT